MDGKDKPIAGQAALQPGRATGPAAPSTSADIASFLTKASQIAPPVQTTPATARLMFALDATLSRQPAWDQAMALQGDVR